MGTEAIIADQILDASTVGKDALRAANAASFRTVIGAGTSSFDGAYSSLSGIPSTFTPADHNQAWNTIISTPTTLVGYGIVNAYTKTETDALVTSLLELAGDLNCSANPNYPAANKGDAYYITAPGKVGGASGITVAIGDLIVAKEDNGGGTQAAVGASWFILENTIVGFLMASNNLSDLTNLSTARTNLGLGSAAVSSSSDFAASVHVHDDRYYTESEIDSLLAGLTPSSHSHGNITNTGAIGVVANLPLITTTSGVITVGAFGTTANTFCQGNDSRLSDARTPTAHNHGNITNTGAIGVVANLPLITTTSGVITVGAFGTTANTFCQGDDSRLSDARTPTAHVHGNITNTGAIGVVANRPLITTTSGVITVGAFGTTANTFCQGNDYRLSNARTPTAHNHGNITNTGAIGVVANLPLITTTSGVITVGAFGTTANTFCQGNDSRLSDARTPTAHNQAWNTITSTPTTILGYGITDAYTKSEIDTFITGLLELKNDLNCSTNPNYPSASKGDAYYVSVAGKVGGASGVSVDVGDVIVAKADNGGGTQAAVGSSWFVLEHNVVGALMASNNLSDLSNAATARSNLGLGTLATQNGTISDYLTTAIASSTYQPIDADLTAIGSLAGTSGLLRKTAADTWTLDTATYSTFDGAYSSLSGIPSTFTPASHVHGNITNTGAIGSTANLPLITTTSGVITTGAFGTTANTFCQGDDSRLSDARTPTAHNQAWSTITSTPTTLAGYGITDALPLAGGTMTGKATFVTANSGTASITLPHGSAPSSPVNGDGWSTTVGLFMQINGGTQQFVTLTNTVTLTNKTLTDPIISTISNTGTLTLPTSTDTLVGRTTTDTLTNKRIQKRVVSTTSASSLTPDISAADFYEYTALAAGLTINNPTGTPVNGELLNFRLQDNGTGRALTWGAQFRSMTATLPTTTVANKTHRVLCEWNSGDSTWDCLAVSAQP